MKKLLKEIETLTNTNYEITPEEFDKVDDRAIAMIEELIGEYIMLKEEFEEYKEYVEDNSIVRKERYDL